MFDNLTGKLEQAFKNIKGEGKLTELNIAKSIKEIRRALVAADVNYKIAKEFTDNVRDEALGKSNVLSAVKPGELMVKIVMDEMVELMGGKAEGLNLAGKPSVILVAGLQGSGKTTFSGKLALYLKEKKQKKVLLVACDVYRPAAIDQLTVVAEKASAGIYKEIESKDPVSIAKNAIKYAKDENYLLEKELNNTILGDRINSLKGLSVIPENDLEESRKKKAQRHEPARRDPSNLF